MSLASQIEAYAAVLLRWGAEVAMLGTAALLARDAESKWWTDEN